MSKIVQLRNILLGYIVLEEVRYWDFLISPENPRDKVSHMEKSNNVRKVAVSGVLSGKHYVCNRVYFTCGPYLCYQSFLFSI